MYKQYITLCLLCVLLVGCNNKKSYIDDINIQNNFSDIETGIYGDDLPVTRASAAKMLAFLYNNKNEIELMQRKISFNDTDIEKWYDKYINAVFINGVMSGTGDGSNFEPDTYLTLEQSQILLDKIIKENKFKIKMNNDNKNKPVSYALWLDVYKKMYESLKSDISENDITVLATNKNNDKINQNYIVCDNGVFGFDEFDMGRYIDKKINVLCNKNEIIAIKEIKEIQPTIKNVYILNNTNDEINIFTGGVQRTYKINTQNNYSGKIANITINEDTIKSIKVFDDYKEDTIKLIDDSKVELLNNGSIKLDESLKIYDTVEEVKWKNKDSVLCGGQYEFLIEDNKVSSIIIRNVPKPNKIRVTISTDDFKSLLHDNVVLSCTENFTVKDGDMEKNFNKNEDVKISAVENRVYITPQNNGKVLIKNIKRNLKVPQYRGVIEVSKKDDKYIIINELDLEEYLYSVVASEMPSHYGEEACKVQALAARSYAYNQFYSNRFAEYGANVDDSVSSQVYNNIDENDISIKAVNDTKGQCITYDGNVINANFFSTSCGITADSGDVWANYNIAEYPTTTVQYLKGNIQGNEKINLENEEDLKLFLKNKTPDCYEKDFPWFRWNVSMSIDEISKSVNANVSSLYKKNIHFIKTLDEDGNFKSNPIEDIGNITDIEVVKRGRCGNIMELKITGTKNIIIVSTEQNIRSIIRPKQYITAGEDIQLIKNDGSVIKNMEGMPSSFYCFDKVYDENNNIKEIKFYGGGYGHGVGMSQNGVLALAQKGLDYQKIIEHFYNYTKVENVI